MSFIILGIFAGLLAGMFGIGGGIVIVPALILIFNFAAQQASGTSLAALLLPAGSIALLQYKKAGLLNIKVSALIALGIFIGSASGAAIALNINAVLLKQLYGAFGAQVDSPEQKAEAFRIMCYDDEVKPYLETKEMLLERLRAPQRTMKNGKKA